MEVEFAFYNKNIRNQHISLMSSFVEDSRILIAAFPFDVL